MKNDIQQQWNEKLEKLNSTKPSEKEMEALLPILSTLIDSIGSSDAKSNPSTDILLLNVLSMVIKGLQSEKQKIWFSLMILETLHDERKKVHRCQCIYEESHNITANAINDSEEKRKKKYDGIKAYKGVLDSIIKKLADWFSKYMLKNKDVFFKRNIGEDSKEAYITEIESHYQKGNPWTQDDSFRPNVIDKVETYFRGFSAKSCKNSSKKTKKSE